MEGKKAFPLWEQTKLIMAETLWSAQANLNLFRLKKNPKYYELFKQQCISSWIFIRPYRAKFTKKNPTNATYVKELDGMLLEIPPGVEPKRWIQLFKFLTDSFKKLGVTDVGKMEDEEVSDYAMLEGFWDND